jgi:hypothetical protein
MTNAELFKLADIASIARDGCITAWDTLDDAIMEMPLEEAEQLIIDAKAAKIQTAAILVLMDIVDDKVIGEL